MLGVPRSQIRLMVSQFHGGLTGYIHSKLEHVLTEVPYHDNYFWRVYLTGGYTRECCPNYLREQHQPALKTPVKRRPPTAQHSPISCAHIRADTLTSFC